MASGRQRLRELDRSDGGRARRAADQQAFFARDAARHQERIAVGDAHHLVDHAQVDGLGEIVHPDALDRYDRGMSPE